MKKNLRCAALYFAIMLASVFIGAMPIYAAQDDVYYGVLFETNGVLSDGYGRAFSRSGALWVSVSSLRAMGAGIKDASNGKGVYIYAENPAALFGIPSLEHLVTTDGISLYFSSFKVGDEKYIDVTGMQGLLKMNYRYDGNNIIFTPNAGDRGYIAERSKNPLRDGDKVALVWDYVTKPEDADLSKEAKIPGLNVISPTWFNLMAGDGSAANRALLGYTDAAHAKGYNVWALVSNSFNEKMTTAFFANNRAMDKFIAQILIYAKIYGLDGINVDFEGMAEGSRNSFSQFIARFANYARAEGLRFSVDVFIPANTKSSRQHDRAAIARAADCVMLMAYDEHWRTCPRAGSVASKPWVIRALENTLAEGVPAKKLVLGMPFYTRRWETTNGKVKSFSLSMADCDNIVAKNGLQKKWLEREGQNYVSYMSNGKKEEIWIEDEMSMAWRVSLVSKYDLAGVAAWSKGKEKQAAWNVIAGMFRK
ncbi:MAG: glycosyl hydrolase family 18 protein [Synergistes sp.]|nr:glycosyl hydrolase family 18 protein [Synergistes sp.]